MKRFLFTFATAIVLLFSSCKLNQSEHWIVVQVCQNDCLLDVENKTINASIDYPIVGHCFLIPLCDKKIVFSKIEYDTEYLDFLYIENNDLYFKPLKTGITKFRVYTDKYGSATTLNILIK